MYPAGGSDQPPGLNSSLEDKFLKGFISYWYLLIKKKIKNQRKKRLARAGVRQTGTLQNPRPREGCLSL